MEDVSMGQALTEMLSFFLGCVVDFLSSPPGIYLWALMLVFFLVGLLARLITLPSLGLNSRFLSLIHRERR